MTPNALTQMIDATWPAKSKHDLHGWTIREGAGGGSRVSAATALNVPKIGDISSAETAMRDLGQTPLFMVRAGEDELDAALETAGYVVKDPTVLYSVSTTVLTTQRPPAVTCFQVWPPLATQVEIWAAGGVDDARLAVMHRAQGPKTCILGRIDDTPAGTAFGAIYNNTAMLHAIETTPAFRRQGLGRHMIRALAYWAQDHGATNIALLVTKANSNAINLYTSMGFAPVGGYQYRIHPEA